MHRLFCLAVACISSVGVWGSLDNESPAGRHRQVGVHRASSETEDAAAPEAPSESEVVAPPPAEEDSLSSTSEIFEDAATLLQDPVTLEEVSDSEVAPEEGVGTALTDKESESAASKSGGLLRREAATPRVDCSWATWGEWFPCTLSCGGGYQARWREFGRYPQGGGSQCTGKSHQLKNCNTHRCFKASVDEKINCAWAAWSEWGACSETCGGGVQEAVRSVGTYPQNGGDNCVGKTRKYQSCYPQIQCPVAPIVDCQWSEWSEWESCSKKCGNGTRSTWRAVKIHPQNGGKECLGSTRRTEKCIGDCTVSDCTWAPWSAWGTCSKSCGGGVQQGFRSIAQFPTEEGRPCAGIPWREQKCNKQACPAAAVDCLWSEWQNWGDCSKSCGGGVREAMREVFRYPQNNGKDCLGSVGRSQPCAMKACPDPRIDCDWGDWSVWTGCTATCGGGTQQTTRMVMTYPQFGGANCEGDRVQIKLCNTHKCKEERIDCLWGEWSTWGTCSRSCGNGTTESFRDIEVFPQNGGLNCVGKSHRTGPCTTRDCEPTLPINCTWGSWAGWEQCSHSCGGGTQRAWREIAVHPQNGGEECPGSMMKWQECNKQACLLPDGRPFMYNSSEQRFSMPPAASASSLVAKVVRSDSADSSGSWLSSKLSDWMPKAWVFR